ncbi:MAG: tandem-95 repeat protein [Magnetococcales bacterium]|nr:tandem-95 repeat protein [Magnetococcales bacterium]NGZ06235.1 tandem-95 repeat protein [Magnetococcales bacterium]
MKTIIIFAALLTPWLTLATNPLLAATPTVSHPIPDQTWSASGIKRFQFPVDTFTDAAGHALTYTATLGNGTALPAWLSFNSATRTFSGNPPSGQTRLTLRVTASDSQGGRVTDTFYLNFSGTLNDAPVVTTPLSPLTWNGSGNKSFRVPLSTFSDGDGDTLTYTAKLGSGAALPTWLRFTASTRTFSGNPPAGLAPLTLRVTVNDGHGGSRSNQFTLSFGSATNDTPVAVPETLTVANHQTLSDTLTATDGDGDRLTYRIVTNGTKGRATLTNTTTGAFTYRPNSGASGTDTFRFKVNDGRIDSNTATITVNITNPNDAPTAANSTLTTSQNRDATGQLSASDADQDPLTYTIVTQGTKGVATLTNTTGSYRYTPNTGASGTDSFTFKAHDGRLDSNIATVTVTIQPTQSTPAPVARTGQTTSYASGDDGALQKGAPWPTPRFTDNDNGTITDHLTNLVWMKNANCWDQLSWGSALNRIAALNAGSQGCSGYVSGTHTNWRLPNIKEMRSLIDRGRVTPGLPANHPFSGVQSDYYWSSTTTAGTSGGNAWVVYLGSGFISSASKSPTCYVWPVRDAP